MKKFVISIVAILGLAACEPVPSTPISPEAGRACSSIGELAETVMGVRQQGVPKSELQQVVSAYIASQQVDGNTSGLVSGIVDEAYRLPQENSATGRQQAISQFGLITRAACVQALA